MSLTQNNILIATQQRVSRVRRYRGAAMVEFALISLALYLVMAALFTFGRAIFAAQVLQQTADVMAHELARTPLPATYKLDDALADTGVTTNLFSEADLDLDISEWANASAGSAFSSETLDQYLANDRKVPLVNRLLAPLMIIDQRNTTSGTQTHLWYPGSYKNPTDHHYYVNILHGTDGGFLPYRVIEPIANTAPNTTDLFQLSLSGTTVTGGLSALRINYAFQSASLSAMKYFDSNGQPITGANIPQQSGVKEQYIVANGETFDNGATRGGMYGGPNFLGQQKVAAMIVRPFQRLISGQAVYRREVFAP